MSMYGQRRSKTASSAMKLLHQRMQTRARGATSRTSWQITHATRQSSTIVRLSITGSSAGLIDGTTHRTCCRLWICPSSSKSITVIRRHSTPCLVTSSLPTIALSRTWRSSKAICSTAMTTPLKSNWYLSSVSNFSCQKFPCQISDVA